MSVNRGRLNWGLFFIAAGAVALAFRLGLLSAQAFGGLGQLWPVVLVAIGVALVLGQVAGSGVGGALVAVILGVVVGALVGGGVGNVGCQAPTDGRQAAAREEGTFAGPATVSLHLACGQLRVAAESGDRWLVESSADGGETRLVSSGSELTLRAADARGYPFGGDGNRSEWRVTLPTTQDLDLDLEVSAGAADLALPAARVRSFTSTVNGGSIEANLREATLRELGITVNAGSITLELPAASLSGSVTVNAGSSKLCVPRDSGVRIRFSGGLGGNNFEDFGLRRSGDLWESSNYASAANRIELSITANAGSANIEASGGCA